MTPFEKDLFTLKKQTPKRICSKFFLTADTALLDI